MTRRKLPPDYQGSVTWSKTDDAWLVAVNHAHGGSVPIDEVFRGVTLGLHLENAGLEKVQSSLSTSRYLVVVSIRTRHGQAVQRRKLLAVLKQHYPKHKGLAIKWSSG